VNQFGTTIDTSYVQYEMLSSDSVMSSQNPEYTSGQYTGSNFNQFPILVFDLSKHEASEDSKSKTISLSFKNCSLLTIKPVMFLYYDRRIRRNKGTLQVPIFTSTYFKQRYLYLFRQTDHFVFKLYFYLF
jgi:hypothetical protein